MGSSLSELSDAGSCETFSEYDIKRNKVHEIFMIIANKLLFFLLAMSM